MGNIATTENAGWLGLGWLTSLGLSALFGFYPAFILGLTISRAAYGVVIDPGYSSMSDEYFTAVSVHVIATIIIALVIVGLARAKQYFIVLMMYLITLWPFLYILNHWANAGGWDHGVYTEYYPIPLDWCFLW